MHYLIPLMFLLDWVLTETGGIYLWKFLGYWIIYPLIYLAQVIIIGTLTGFYPYFCRFTEYWDKLHSLLMCYY